MPHGVRDDLLGGPHERGARLLVSAHPVCHADPHPHAGHTVADTPQGPLEVGCLHTQPTHGLAHVAKQLARDRVRGVHVTANVHPLDLPRRFELERESRELVPEEIMQVARDPQPLCRARGLRKQHVRGAQLEVCGSKLAPEALLAHKRERAEERCDLDQHVEPRGDRDG